MNISGPQYSKSTVGLRQPKQILDQQLKLVFIYPILCDESLTKYQDQIRSFISVSMLKEIYVSNSLNIMTMASNISPLIDSGGNPVDVDSHLIQNLNQELSGSIKRQVQQDAKFDIQQRVNERTAHIKRLLDVDPNLRKFKPYLEMITMNNFIDIPVIVGTKAFQIDTFVLLFMLMIAVADKKISMSSYTDIERIFRIIKNTKSNDLNDILDHLINLPNETAVKKIVKWIYEKLPNQRPPTDKKIQKIWNTVPNALSKIKQKTTNTKLVQQSVYPTNRQKSNLIDDEMSLITKNASDAILNVTNNNVNTASIFFKLAMDPEQMAKQFGYEPKRGQLSSTFERINPRIESVFADAENMFAKTIWPTFIEPVLSSFLYTIVPRDSGVNVSDIVIALQNGDNSKNIKGIFGPILNYINNDFKKELNNTIEKKGPEEADRILELMKNFCTAEFSNSTDMLNMMYRSLIYNSLKGPDYSIDEHITYEKQFEKIITNISSHMHVLERSLKTMLPNSLVDSLLIDKTSKVINDGLNSVITYFRTLKTPDGQISFPESTAYFNHERTSLDRTNIEKYISESKKQIIFYIRKHFLYLIQYILCKYVSETKVAVETTKHDVLDSNNYTLIIPIETIMTIANAYAAKSYRDFYNKTKRAKDDERVNSQQLNIIRNLNDNYVKGIIKFIHQQLDVPNLFVIDEKKNKIHYKLMYQSDVNNININTMDTYIKNILNTYSN
jgi:hypothetical protein